VSRKSQNPHSLPKAQRDPAPASCLLTEGLPPARPAEVTKRYLKSEFEKLFAS